ncbi:MAG: AI-2E family transporter, partial [Chloroflexota bacterium]|nr:AI-2E family transporter [Chloroflexota bacterium]
MSRKWSDSTKRWVIAGSALALALLIYRFRQIIPPFIIAVMLAYVLSPLASFLMAKTRLSRTWATVSIYLVLLVAIGVASAAFVPGLTQQIRGINLDLERTAASIRHLFERPLFVFGFSFDLLDIYNEVSSTLQGLASSFALHTVSLLIDLASGFGWAFFILFVSFYLLKDADKFGQSLMKLVPSDHQDEIRRLGREVNAAWNAFFRSQLVLCAVVGFMTWVALWVVGVKNALVLGIVAGILEVIPNFGPTISAIPAVLIAFFQGSTHLSISNGWFALLVIGLYLVIQQLENRLLVPHIIGHSL